MFWRDESLKQPKILAFLLKLRIFNDLIFGAKIQSTQRVRCKQILSRKAMIDSLCGTQQFEEMFNPGEVIRRSSRFVRSSFRKISDTLRPSSTLPNAATSFTVQNEKALDPEEKIEFKRDL